MSIGFEDDIASYVWSTKYRQISRTTGHCDESFDETIERVVRHVCAGDEAYSAETRDAIRQLEFLPGGRILAAADTVRDATLVNTFVMERIVPDMSRVLDLLHLSIKTMRMGGGIGINLSRIPPQHHTTSSGTSPGIVAYIELLDRMAATSATRYRQPAMLLALDVSHPEIVRFIEAKRNSNRFSTFNASVLIGDDFIEAVDSDAEWHLQFEGMVVQKISARKLWQKILTSAYDSAEPGMIFIDTVQRANPLSYCEEIIGTNSCAEQPLPPFGAVPLASINLSALVECKKDHTFLNIDRLRQVSRIGVQFLDRLLDSAQYPDPRQEAEALLKRRIGLGVTGLADALALCGFRYGSPEACAKTIEWLSILREAAYRTSGELAEKYGSFPAFNASAFLDAPSLSWLPSDLRSTIREKGLRNAVLLTSAPTGSLSLLAGNISSGVEPIFSHNAIRRIRTKSGEIRTVALRSALAKRIANGLNLNLSTIPTAEEITPEEHIDMLSSVLECTPFHRTGRLG